MTEKINVFDEQSVAYMYARYPLALHTVARDIPVEPTVPS